MKFPLLTVQIRYERDVVLSRQRARQIAKILGFDNQDQVRLSTTISELARNVYQYAKKGKIEFACDDITGEVEATISDQGPGILKLKEILAGDYVSETGMGVGLIGAKRLMDAFHIDTSPKGTSIVVRKKQASPTPISRQRFQEIIANLASDSASDPFQEIQRQNQELLVAMDALQNRQDQLDQLNKELEDTNRGVVALYAELDEKADYLRRASEIKTRFLSNMTHEFRTPLNSILALSRMLLDRIDGDLSVEQDKQVSFIRRAASDLSELVNDLLDLSKVEAGKIVIKPSDFSIKDMFGALRGMLRPLLAHNNSINLIFEEDENLPLIFTDESKLSQILRNFISNAIKYTDKGEVRVSATWREDKVFVLTVKDTGIGIASENLLMIFDEFTQIEGAQQKKSKGTGLGLSLSKRLAEVLGGSVTVESKLGVGSSFSVILPQRYHGQSEVTYVSEIIRKVDPSRGAVLIIDDNIETLFLYESYLKGTPFQAIPMRSIKHAREALVNLRPMAIILDILLEHENTWSFLSELKRDPAYRNVPVYVVTMVENESKARRLGADDFHLKPLDRDWLLEKLNSLDPLSPRKKILLIDDDEVSRYLFRGLLSDTALDVIEAGGGYDGIQLATESLPDVVFLDLNMPDLGGLEVLKRLRGQMITEKIPIVVYTSDVHNSELNEQSHEICGILSKDFSSREQSRENLVELLNKAGVFKS